MSARHALAGRRRRRVGVYAALVLALVSLSFAGKLPGTGPTPRAAGQGGAGEPTVQTDDSVPAAQVVMIGATPAESGAPRDETWGVGTGATGPVLVRYAAATQGIQAESGWSLATPLQNEAGQPITGFALDAPAAATSSGPSPLAGQMTPDGAGVLAGTVDGNRQVLLVREPNNSSNPFRETPAVPEADLQAGEQLYGFNRAPLIAPLDEVSGDAGALVVPVREHGGNGEEDVLHFDSESGEWTREQIELPPTAIASEFRVLGIGASSPKNAWLIAQLSEATVGLFHRRLNEGEVPTWVPVALHAGGEAGEAVRVDGEPLTVPGERRERVQTQVLTVTSQGVWIDAERPEVSAPTTVFYTPEGAGSGPSITSWCTTERSTPGTAGCEHTLPEALPSGPSRSIAWANSSGGEPFGERVVTGLADGVSLRLEGTTFVRVLGLGGTAGSSFGAAFSSPSEGWLGDEQLPEHLTLEPAPSRLAPWPVPFRHALTAIAPQPGAPVASLSSEALAVGDFGEVARYDPGQGWLPESLFAAGGRRQTPRLRAVAWPTPSRAYAVGDLGQMWLWRGETGLWEPDPAAPYNFRGNLLGVAFDPNNPARGYAVGESGVLLSYGKTWTQEAAASLPPEVANASFTSVAFAGSEAIVAYRILPDPSTNRYIGGLLVNDGSGWRVDTGAAAAMGSGVPWAVAGLPDGGAAFAASGVVYERQAPGAPWQAVSTPFPGGGEPGSLALFREGGALRAIAAGSPPNTFSVESALPAPPGFPPTLIKPYPLPSNDERGVLRQTATGWSDEEHELNDAREPAGHWSFYDQVFQPDPTSAVLVDPAGAQGWAVGGFVEPEEHGGVLDTADIARYRGEATAPLGVGKSAVPVDATKATFAIGGNAVCAAPCANRANARIGPDVWLKTALEHADVPGVRAFFYTGPRLVSPNAINGPKTEAARVPFAAELDRYAQILRSSPFPAYAAGSPTDLDEVPSEGTYEQAFSGFPSPMGEGAPAAALAPAGARPSACGSTAGCQSGYYALESTGSAGTVRVIVLDDTQEVAAAQLAWLEAELAEAKAAGQPAIVVGNADLAGEIAAGNHPAARSVVGVLVRDGASAYFFDSPEQNVSETLSAGAGSIPAFGSGTLGYVSYVGEASGAFLGASGFLLAEVEVASRNKATNVAKVTAKLIPNIGELAMEAEEGNLLRRSQAALFAALARRPRAGNRSAGGGANRPETDLYIPIPSNCVGVACANGIFPEYSFSSSRPDIGDFVAPNLASANPLAVLLNAQEEPVHDSSSGLFCAFNAGTTVVTISAGGLSASLPVTVQSGSVRRPCGTKRLTELPVPEQQLPAPVTQPQPTPTGASPTPVPVPLPAPPANPPAPSAKVAVPAFFLPAGSNGPLLAALPPPVPTPARPTPPGGTSSVTTPVEAPEKQEEKEEATESVSNQALSYDATEHEPASGYIIGIVLLAAFAGACARRRPRRDRREARIAPATISGIHSQRRMSDRGRRRGR